jgi:hypothetical protein
MPPTCARQATGNSVGPQIDVAERSRRDLLAVREVGELQAPAGSQHPHNLGEDLALVGAELMTPLLITTSAQPFSIGRASITPRRNSTLLNPIVAAAARDRLSIS